MERAYTPTKFVREGLKMDVSHVTLEMILKSADDELVWALRLWILRRLQHLNGSREEAAEQVKEQAVKTFGVASVKDINHKHAHRKLYREMSSWDVRDGQDNPRLRSTCGTYQLYVERFVPVNLSIPPYYRLSEAWTCEFPHNEVVGKYPTRLQAVEAAEIQAFQRGYILPEMLHLREDLEDMEEPRKKEKAQTPVEEKEETSPESVLNRNDAFHPQKLGFNMRLMVFDALWEGLSARCARVLTRNAQAPLASQWAADIREFKTLSRLSVWILERQENNEGGKNPNWLLDIDTLLSEFDSDWY